MVYSLIFNIAFVLSIAEKQPPCHSVLIPGIGSQVTTMALRTHVFTAQHWLDSDPTTVTLLILKQGGEGRGVVGGGLGVKAQV